jgi:tRNA-dihydrouridine synthase B
LIGNGDVNTPEDVKAMFETGCDGVMIGRGAIANPWIFRQAKHYMKTGQSMPEPSVEEKIGMCLEHLKLNVEHKGERYGVQTFRKHYVGYLKGLPNITPVRTALMKCGEFKQVEDTLMAYKDSVHAEI